MDHSQERRTAAQDRPRRHGRRVALAAILAGLTGACMASPLNDQEVPSKSQPVRFSGFVVHPATPIFIYSLNDFNEWINIGFVQASEVPQTDAVGGTWYQYDDNVFLPHFEPFWRQIIGQRRMTASVKARAFPFAREDMAYDIATFDTTAGPCAQAFAPSGIAAIINNCRSPESPVVTVTMPCGGNGQACCEFGPCDGGLSCQGSSTFDQQCRPF